MTTKQRRIRLRRMLESYRGRLLGEIAERMHHVRDESGALRAGDILDRVGRVQEEDVDCALLGIQSGTVRRVEEALRRVDAGTYGRCAGCGQDISDARLLALPFAIRCRNCEARAEEIPRRQSPPLSQALFDERYA